MPLKNKRIYLSPPHMNGDEINYVKDAIQSNWVAPLGPHVDQFEDEMAKYIEKKGYKGIIAEGADYILNGRSPNFLYSSINSEKIKILKRKRFKTAVDGGFGKNTQLSSLSTLESWFCSAFFTFAK